MRTLGKILYFPLIDSARVYKQFGLRRAIEWFGIRLLVPFGVSQPKPVGGETAVANLRNFGFAELPRRNDQEVANLVRYFLARQSVADATMYEGLSQYFEHWRSQSVLRPPALIGAGATDCPMSRLSRDPAICSLVCDYLGLPASKIRVQSTIDALIRVTGKAVLVGGYDGAVEFHRDIDSWRWVKVFVYLTETSDGDGHHEVIPASQLRTPMSLVPIRRYKQSEILAEMPHLKVKKMCGPAGYTFIENTFAFHRGTEPTRNDRLILIMTYYDDSVSNWMFADQTYPLDWSQ
jgi:hypothetical protein